MACLDVPEAGSPDVYTPHHDDDEERKSLELTQHDSEENLEVDEELSTNLRQEIRNLTLINGVSNRTNLHDIDELTETIMSELSSISSKII